MKPKTKAKKSPYTIPRLELLGVLIGVRALNFLKKQLSVSINLDKLLFLWTDSSTVLNWLNNDEQINDVFVNNRIKEIRQIDHLEVGHVTGYSNPADLASRGENDVDSFQNNQMYWHGPLWLLSNEWPTHKFVKNFSSEKFKSYLENSPQKEIFSFCNTVTQNESFINISRYSRLPKLLRVTSYTLRFIAKIKNKKEGIFKNFFSPSLKITSNEINTAIIILIKIEQNIAPPNESVCSALGIYKDENELLRCKRITSVFPLLHLWD